MNDIRKLKIADFEFLITEIQYDRGVVHYEIECTTRVDYSEAVNFLLEEYKVIKISYDATDTKLTFSILDDLENTLINDCGIRI